MNNNVKLRTLQTIFVISVVIANVVGARTVTTGASIAGIPLSMSGGALTYIFTFLATDVIGEVWGKKEAQDLVKYGFIGQVFAVVMIIVTGWIPATDAAMDASYVALLGQTWFFVLGSLSGFAVSQTWDVFIFHKIRTRIMEKTHNNRARWIWNNVSTITSQAFDTVIYAIISFGFGLGWLWTAETRTALLGLIIGQYVLKVMLAVLDTPIFYLLTREKSKAQ